MGLDGPARGATTARGHICSLGCYRSGGQHARRPEGKNIVKKIVFGIAAAAIFAAGLVFVAPAFVSTKDLQERALAQVERATGYRVRVDGPVEIAVFPSLDLVAHDVGITRPGAGRAIEFATARTLRFGLVLRSLLGGKVNLTEVTLVDPVIALPLPEAAGPRPAAPKAEGTAARRDLSIHQLTIRNGTVVLPGENGMPGIEITGVDAEASLPAANGPLAFTATARLDDDPFAAEGTVGNFTHFLDGGTVPVRLALQTTAFPDHATMTGVASYRDGVLTLAQVEARSGPHALSGSATYGDDTLTVSEGMFDDTPFTGTARLAGGTLTVDGETALEGKPVRLTGSLGPVDAFLGGEPAPIELSVVAPEHLEGAGTLSGAVSYNNDTLTLPEFTVVAGEDTVSGAAVYNDGVLTLSEATWTFEDRTVAGNVTYRDDTADIDVMVTRGGRATSVIGSIVGIERLLDGEPAPTELEIASPDGRFEKTKVTGGASYREGMVRLTGFTAVSGLTKVTGDGVYKDGVLVLDPVKAQTKDRTASGALTVNLAGDIPGMTGALTVTGAAGSKRGGAPPQAAKTDTASPDPALNPLGQPPGSGTEAGRDAPPSPEQQRADAPKPGKTEQRRLGWRAEKLDLSALKEMNADLAVTLDQFVFEDISIRAATFNAKLAGGKLTAETKTLKAYGGGGTMTFALDASGAVPAYRLNLAVTGVDAYPFLRDVAGFDAIEGKAAITLDLTASGESERAIVSSLNGTARFEFTNGALRGLNVANMLRNLTTGILTGWQYKRDLNTAFTTLEAGFEIAGGQAKTNDLRMVGPLVSIGGQGTADLPEERLKFRVNPLMLARVQGQGGKNNMLGFPVPIAVTGPWDKPAIYPDIVGILESPVAAYRQLDKLGGGLISMPTDLLGIDTGDGGLLEKGVAIPGAITRGVVGGIGEALGVKKRGAQPPAPAAAEPAAPSTPAPATEPSEPGQGAQETPPRAAAGEAVQKKKPVEEPPNQPFQGTFGQ